MHKASQEDPAPDSLEYRNDVWCEHGSLALNHLNRRRISTEVRCPPWASNFFDFGYLRELQSLKENFPLWNPPAPMLSFVQSAMLSSISQRKTSAN